MFFGPDDIDDDTDLTGLDRGDDELAEHLGRGHHLELAG